ncbi:VirD1 [Roseibium sp. TrichSKD4]|uniref:DNA mobilization endonuclease VirD1/MobC family subunit n=1 Tax=Roseibium sp. TrichSKD4 TaxID=744980 RepID=UPI0001E57222|nr:DNA mobilization endonuclease VirD1/MobC family subunit [Roseibium sp. TrichSKD4]EFO28784.1 VirD1 [Roseibium sp. TrichSKD4]
MSAGESGNEGGKEALSDTDWVVISVRMRRAEVAALDALCEEVGAKRNRVLRVLVLHARGFLDYDNEVRATLRDLLRQVGGIATNINQIAKAANVTGKPEYERFFEERKSFGKLFARVETQIQILLNLKTRKADAEGLLRKALGQ